MIPLKLLCYRTYFHEAHKDVEIFLTHNVVLHMFEQWRGGLDRHEGQQMLEYPDNWTDGVVFEEIHNKPPSPLSSEVCLQLAAMSGKCEN